MLRRRPPSVPDTRHAPHAPRTPSTPGTPESSGEPAAEARRGLTRGRVATLLALTLLLAAAPFVPRGSQPESTLRTTSQERSSAYGAVTPAMQAEIDRVVAAGLAQPAFRGKPDAATLISSQVRCATFEGLQYCLNVGWTEATQAQVQARLGASLNGRSTTGTETTGDLDVAATLALAASADPRSRAAAERDELTRAAAAVAKVWQIRHDIEGVPYPSGFLARHPEARATAASASASGTTSAAASTAPEKKKPGDYPGKDKILNGGQTAEQTRTYWCGPASMQMIAWGWRGKRQTQGRWANRLGTTSSGSSITSMVNVVNDATGWDRKAYAGPYVTLDIANYSFGRWYLLMMRHVHDYRAPVVMHPILLKRYFPYLDDDASGHFQVGRGYAKRGDKPNLISYFEPWNQQRFDPSEPFIGRVQWRNAYKSYRANQAHPLHNVGV